MSDIELHERYPLSRREDITDAYMRGVEYGRKMGLGTCTMAHEMSEADDVLRSIDQLRRDLSGYHGQLKAYNDLQKHCDNQRKRIVVLEGLYVKAKAKRSETAMSFSKEHDRAEFLMRENAKLRKLLQDVAICACGRYCYGCPHQYDGCDRDEKLRELRIEVE